MPIPNSILTTLHWSTRTKFSGIKALQSILLGMSILQNSLFDYNTALSQFLEVRRQQHPSLGLGFFPVLGSVSGSDTTESLSPSPPAVNNTSKSFTIDAILGLRCKTNDGSTVLDYSTPSSSKKNNGELFSSRSLWIFKHHPRQGWAFRSSPSFFAAKGSQLRQRSNENNIKKDHPSQLTIDLFWIKLVQLFVKANGDDFRRFT